jgi:hypothetical protein
VDELSAGVVRTSSLVEDLNSRLRNSFFLRRYLGEDYWRCSSSPRTTGGICGASTPTGWERVLRSC